MNDEKLSNVNNEKSNKIKTLKENNIYLINVLWNTCICSRGATLFVIQGLNPRLKPLSEHININCSCVIRGRR